MPYFPIKAGFGTRTSGGGLATKPSGSMSDLGASNVYANILAALADPAPPISGDIGLCSDLHDFNNGASAITYVFSATGIPFQIYSVDDGAVETYKKGAKEETNGLIRMDGKADFMGMFLDTASTILAGLNNSQISIKDGEIILSSSGDYFGAIYDGSMFDATSTVIRCAHPSNGLLARGGSSVNLTDCTFVATTTVTNLFISNARDGGGRVNCLACDLSVIDGNLLANHGNNQTSDDALVMIVDRCVLNASVNYVQEAFSNRDSYIEVTNSASTSAKAEYQYYRQYYQGSAQDSDDAGIHRAESGETTDGKKVSIRAITSANTSRLNPLSLNFPSRFAALSVSATDTIRIFFTVIGTVILTNQDIWCNIIYPDGTNKNDFKFASNENVNPLAIGITHIADTGSTWMDGTSDLTGYNEYYMDITAVDAYDCVPKITINIAIPSEAIHIDTSVGSVAG